MDFNPPARPFPEACERGRYTAMPGVGWVSLTTGYTPYPLCECVVWVPRYVGGTPTTAFAHAFCPLCRGAGTPAPVVLDRRAEKLKPEELLADLFDLARHLFGGKPSLRHAAWSDGGPDSRVEARLLLDGQEKWSTVGDCLSAAVEAMHADVQSALIAQQRSTELRQILSLIEDPPSVPPKGEELPTRKRARTARAA